MALQLIDFDNLAKTLTYCIYIMGYTDTEESKNEFIEYINKTYGAGIIHSLIDKIAKMINANILDVTEYDYYPYGASINALTSDLQLSNDDICAHLDKSHISVHTYPEIGKESSVSYIRIDLEISTCGSISPLKSLPIIIDYFDPDVMTYDFVIRGVTKNGKGKKIYTCDGYKRNINDFNKTQAKRYHIIKNSQYRKNGVEVNMLKRKKEFNRLIVGEIKMDRDTLDEIHTEAKKICYRRS